MPYLTVTGSGRLGADPELRFTKNGTPVMSFRIATSSFIKSPTGGQESEPTWVSVSLYGYQAEQLSGMITKGSRVYVSGELIQSNWTSNSGEDKSSLYIRARVVALENAPQKKEEKDPWSNMPAQDLGASEDVPF